MNDIQKQYLLAYLGYYTDVCDGKWGPKSVAACKVFQSDYRIESDGVCGPITQKMLIGVISGAVARKEIEQTTAEEVQNGNDDTTAGSVWDRIKYFKRTDPYIACPCGRCGGFPVEPTDNLMLEADLMRETIGHPMVPSSTVRCQVHNDELPGSVPNSYHVYGCAMDFDIPAVPDSVIINYLNNRKAAGGIMSWYQMTSGYFHFQVAKPNN